MKKNIGIKHMKKLLMATIVLPGLIYAGSEPTATPFPGAKKGINIWPLAKLNMPMKKETMSQLRSVSVNGYNQTTFSDESVNSLFNVPKIAAKETSLYDNNQNPLDTHLRSDISKLRLSFKFFGIPGVPKEDILGFAPAGGYTHKNGWDGVVEFFQIQNLGVCSFTTFAIESVIIYKESIEYIVNKKPSDKDISGNWDTGFLYRVNWYTDDRRNSLQCANKNLKPGNMQEIVSLANKIDISMNR